MDDLFDEPNEPASLVVSNGMSLISKFYSPKGPLGGWTPTAAIVLNILGVMLGLLMARVMKWMASSTYDLHKIPEPPRPRTVLGWLTGHVPYFLQRNYIFTMRDWAEKYGRIYKVRILNAYTVVISDPAAAAQVVAQVPTRSFNYRIVDEVLGGPGKISMFGTQDEAYWRNVRKTTAPAFAMSNVRRYYRGVLAAAGELLGALEAAAGCGGAVDLEPHVQTMMLRATLQGLFEVPDARLVPGFDRLAPNISLLMAEGTAQISDPLHAAFYNMPFSELFSKHIAACKRARQEVVRFNINTATRLLSRPDPDPSDTSLSACLHRLRHPRSGRRLSPQQLFTEVGLYTTAGFDTTSSTIGWCLYAAALHPGQQEAVAEELQAAGVFGPEAVREAGEGKGEGQGEGGEGGGPLALLPERCPSPEDLARLPRLNAFINEAMRLFPASAVSTERVADQPVKVLGYTIPPGTLLWPNVYLMHTAPHNWEDAREFRPERWLEDKHAAFARAGATAGGGGTAAAAADGGVPDGAGGVAAAAAAAEGAVGDGGEAAAGGGAGHEPRRFVPFSDGPKNCVGQNFATTVIRSVVSVLLRRYRLSLPADGCMGGGPQHTAALTQVAVTTKLKCLRLGVQRREG